MLGADNSDDSQTAGLRALSLESVGEEGSETSHPQEGDKSQKAKTKKPKKIKKGTTASVSQRATTPSGLQGSPSPSTGLATLGSNQSTPILTSTPEGTRKDPILVSDEGGSTSTELYASGVSDISQDENPFDCNNNNNDKETNDTDTNASLAGITGDVQSSSDSSHTLVNPSPPGHLEQTTPGSLGGPHSNDAISGSPASGSPASGFPASGSPRSNVMMPLDSRYIFLLVVNSNIWPNSPPLQNKIRMTLTLTFQGTQGQM